MELLVLLLERAYIYGGQHWDKVFMEYTFKLPDGLSGEKVLLQYFWYTGYCKYLGYDDYLTEANKEKLKWDKSDYPDCPADHNPWHGGHFTGPKPGEPNEPEFFVNCAEVTITASDTPMLRSF